MIPFNLFGRQTNEADAKKRKISNHQIHSIPQLIIVKETSEDSQKDEIGDDCKKVNDDLNASEHLLTRRTSIIDKECDEEVSVTRLEDHNPRIIR